MSPPTDDGTVEQDASGGGGSNVGTGTQMPKRPGNGGTGDSGGGGTGGGGNSGDGGDESGGIPDAGAGSATVGNGGSAIICRDGDDITSIELFDFYEARVIRGWQANVGFTPGETRSILKQAIATAKYVVDNRWKSIDPVMATHLKKRLREFRSDVIFDDVSMELDNELEAVIAPPTGCLREQIVTARNYFGLRSYTIRKDYFNHPKFSNLDRAGLILEELLFDITRDNGAKTSQGARYINSVFFADKQNETLMPQEHYLEVMKEAGFPESSN